MDNSIISPIFYNRTNIDGKQYKVIEFLECRGKTNVEYYKVKFKDTNNIIEAPYKTIIENRVVDIELQKKETKKANRAKKKQNRANKKIMKSYTRIENPIVLALDLASISTGYAIYENKKLIHYGYIFADNDKELTERTNIMKNEIEDIIEKYNINCAVVENVLMGGFIGKILYALSRVHGVILDLLFELEIPVSFLESKEWKTKLNILKFSHIKCKTDRETSKERTIACINDLFNFDIKKMYSKIPSEHKDKKVWEDVIDAIAIGYVFVNNYLL